MRFLSLFSGGEPGVGAARLDMRRGRGNRTVPVRCFGAAPPPGQKFWGC